MSHVHPHTPTSYAPKLYIHRICTVLIAMLSCIGVLVALAGCGMASQEQTPTQTTTTQKKQSTTTTEPITIAATLGQWGALATQIGGKYVQVSSCITDTTLEPSQFTPTKDQRKSLNNAQILVLNGAGLDDWAQQNASSQKNTNTSNTEQSADNTKKQQTTISAAQLIGASTGDNPYLWFSADVRKAVAKALVDELSALDADHASYYQQQLQTYTKSEQQISDAIAALQETTKRTSYITTSNIGQYLLSDMHITNANPDTAQQALENNELLSNDDVNRMQSMLEGHQTQLLVRTTQPADEALSYVNMLGGVAGRSDVPILDISPIMPNTYSSLTQWIEVLVHHVGADLTMPMVKPEQSQQNDSGNGNDSNTKGTNTDSNVDEVPSNEGQTDPGK